MPSKIEYVDETWRWLPDCGRYLVSDNGNVSGPSGKILKPMVSDDGYLYVFIERKKRRVHRLVLCTFVGDCPDGMESRHLDGNPSNNRLGNLSWGTRQENADDRRKHGTMPIPHESEFTKLVPADIPNIRRLHAEDGYSSRKIAAAFSTSHTTIQKILRGERWRGY